MLGAFAGIIVKGRGQNDISARTRAGSSPLSQLLRNREQVLR